MQLSLPFPGRLTTETSGLKMAVENAFWNLTTSQAQYVHWLSYQSNDNTSMHGHHWTIICTTDMMVAFWGLWYNAINDLHDILSMVRIIQTSSNSLELYPKNKQRKKVLTSRYLWAYFGLGTINSINKFSTLQCCSYYCPIKNSHTRPHEVRRQYDCGIQMLFTA